MALMLRFLAVWFGMMAFIGSCVAVAFGAIAIGLNPEPCVVGYVCSVFIALAVAVELGRTPKL